MCVCHFKRVDEPASPRLRREKVVAAAATASLEGELAPFRYEAEGGGDADAAEALPVGDGGGGRAEKQRLCTVGARASRGHQSAGGGWRPLGTGSNRPGLFFPSLSAPPPRTTNDLRWGESGARAGGRREGERARPRARAVHKASARRSEGRGGGRTGGASLGQCGRRLARSLGRGRGKGRS